LLGLAVHGTFGCDLMCLSSDSPPEGTSTRDALRAPIAGCSGIGGLRNVSRVVASTDTGESDAGEFLPTCFAISIYVRAADMVS
jgi:hypothetical protein